MEYMCIVCGDCREKTFKLRNGKFSYEKLCLDVSGRWEVTRDGERHFFGNNLQNFLNSHAKCNHEGFFIEYH